MTDVPIRCRCGKLRGVARGLSAKAGNRLICHCDDCQAFAHNLGDTETLDEHGGTDIYQTSPARIEISEGRQHLACLRQSPRLLRWYAACCKTPLGNTMPTAGFPFVGLIHSGLDFEAAGVSIDDALGPVRGRGFGRYATGDTTTLDATDRFPLKGLLRLLPIVAAARLRGDHKRSPFFDAETGEPSVPPRTPDQL